ncbi:MAG TPA: ABC transporter substrate-binding protein [Magnetospirillaceae bacterium]|jgi:putative hydroxymethylpyrimidine transport system substrate-binding protein
MSHRSVTRVLPLAALGLGLLAAAPASANEKLTVMLDWLVNPDHAALVVAQEKGYFADEGLDVDLIAPADPNDPPKMVAAGKADLAVDYQPQLLIQVNEGLPLTRIATLVSTPLNCLMLLDSSPIKSIADLKGKKVGFSVSGFEDALLGTMFEKNGISLKDVTLINVNFTLSPALISGQVDAVIGAFRNVEVQQMGVEGHPARAFYPEEEGVPAYDELIVVANKDKRADPRFKKFVHAVERATLYVENHPAEAWFLFIKNHKDLNDETNRRAWAATLPRLTADPAALDHDRYVRFAAFLKARGLVKNLPPVDDYAIEPK